MKEFNPLNWYWYVGGDRTKAYSSAAGNYVAINDVVLQAWMSDGSQPTPTDTEINLGGTLAPYYPTVTRPIPATVLDGYQQSQADDVFQRKLVKLLFVLLNRVQVLEGKTALTVTQARAYVKGLM